MSDKDILDLVNYGLQEVKDQYRIYIEGFGGVRIEDLFVVEQNGLRQITKSSKKLLSI